MNTYRSNGHKAVKAEDMAQAANIFANREARRKYGRTGYARTCEQQSHAQNGSFAEYSAFIGRKTGLHETTGNNVHFTVYAN